MEEGSWWNRAAVWRAACFWASVVPPAWDGDDGAGDSWDEGDDVVGEVVIAPKRDRRLLIDGGLWV